MFMKRTSALLLVCALCLSAGLCASAADGGNLMPYPDFEEIRDDGSFPKNWIRSSATNVTLSTDYARSDSYSIKISQDTTNYPYARTTITGIVGGAEYTFGVWLRTMNKNCAFKFRYSCFDTAGSLLHDAAGDAVYNDFTGDWAYFSETFRPPRGTTYMYVQLRIGAPGTVYCDDVSMYLTDGPEMLYDFETDGTFYYTEREEDGVASATVDTSYYPELVGEAVRFSVFDPETPDEVLKEEAVTVPADGNVRFTYPLRLLSEKQKPFVVQCSMQPSGRAEVVKSHTVYTFDRPTHIDDDGFFRDENNEIFTPSIMYGVQLDDLDTLKKAGVNAVQGYPSQEWLDTLHQKEMKCFVVLYAGSTTAGNPSRISTAVKYVNTYKNHPAVFGWLVFDEPAATDETDLEELERAYTQIRAADPAHPVVITANGHYDVLHQYADAIIQDSYPYNNERFTTYPYERNVKAVSESDGRPVYHLMQTFEHLNSFPKPAEIRNMQYASLWAGVKGIGYYKYRGYRGDGTVLSDSELWTPMVSFAENEQDIALDVFVYGKYKKVREAETEAYHWGVWEDGAGEYLVLLRNKKYDAAVSAEILISEDGGVWQAEPVGGSPEVIKTGNGKISVSVGMGDVALFRTKKALLLDAEGKPITSVSAGMTVTILTGHEAKADEAVLVGIAVYQSGAGKKECVYIKIPDGVLSEEENGIKTFSYHETVKIPDGTGEYSIKIFYWNRNLNCLEKVAWGM